MAETTWQKYLRHYRTKGFLYAVYRGVKYFKWRRKCKRMGLDWRQFSQ